MFRTPDKRRDAEHNKDAKQGEPGMSYAGGSPGFYDKGGPGRGKRMAGEKLEKAMDSTPNEHRASAQANFDKEDYATNNQYGQDLSGIKYKEGIEKYYGDDASIGENDIKRMMDAGYSSDDVYNFSKKRGLNYNQHGQKYMKGQGDYQIGKGSDQWGDVFGTSRDIDKKNPTLETNMEPTVTVRPDPEKEKPNIDLPGPGSSGSSQNANQDNDINTTINGNDNTVTNTVDNSIRQYGGVNKSFTYNGSSNGNNYEDTPVSAGTMGGYFYDGDSPGKSAAFLDRYMTQNMDNQKKFENKGRAQDAINKADANQTINIDNLDQRIEARTKANRARSTVMAGNIFGDMFNFSPDKFKGPEAQDPVETPDFKKLGKI